MLIRVRVCLAISTLLCMLLAGCGRPATPPAKAKASASEEAQIKANIKRQVALDKIQAKMKERERQEAHKERELLSARTIQLGESLKLESLEITPQSIEFRKVRWRPASSNRGFEEAGPYLVITLKAKNISSRQKFKPETTIKGTDSSGNPLSSPFPLLSLPLVEGSSQHAELAPGEEATIIVCVQRKLASAKAFEFELATVAKNEPKFADASQRWLLKCKADDIQPAVAEKVDAH